MTISFLSMRLSQKLENTSAKKKNCRQAGDFQYLWGSTTNLSVYIYILTFMAAKKYDPMNHSALPRLGFLLQKPIHAKLKNFRTFILLEERELIYFQIRYERHFSIYLSCLRWRIMKHMHSNYISA